jgi:hypothetical protein
MPTFRDRATATIDFLKAPLGAFLLAAVGIALAIYSTWYNDKTTEISVAELLSSDVLNEHAAVPALEFTFQGKTLDPRKTPVKVALIRIWNTGDTTIRQPDYDTRTPVGFRVENATILWHTIESATTPYLTENTQPKLAKENEVSISPVILEPKDAIIIKIIALQTQSGKLVVKPFGKVAGAPDITERITVRHPAGYIEAFRTPTEDKLRKYWAAFVLIAALLNLIIVLVRDWRTKLKARRASTVRSDG